MNRELSLARNWWSIALRGLITVLFGLAIFIWPILTIEVLVLLFGAFAFVGGLFSIFAAYGAPGKFALILQGILGIVIGLIAFFWPGITAFVLLVLIAVWAIITGILEIILAFSLNESFSGRCLLAVAGLISVIFGFLLASRPGTGLLVVTWLIGTYAIISGVLLFGLALHLHGIQKTIK